MDDKALIGKTFDTLYQGADRGREVFSAQEEGYISSVSDGIVEVKELPNVGYFELLELPYNLFALALNIKRESVQAIVLGDYTRLNVKDSVRYTNRSVSIPVGDALLGQVVDPLIFTLDEQQLIETDERYPIEQEAIPMMQRDFVKEPLYTGIKVIDAMIPIGKGQRELIVSDDALGKTSIAVDTIINQKGKDVLCVYVSIGQKKTQISRVIDDLKRSGALAFTVVIAASADTSAGMKFIAPYAGCAVAEYFRDQGKDVLVVYDDLTKHADAYRSISLLLEIPPGREAYPGDIFFIHSRLLERAGKRSDDFKGGSITALPIIETQAGRLSDYIPTNLISITDGQIYLERELFNKGFLPAIDIGRSVSRIGSKAQSPALKKMAVKLKLDYSQFLEVEIFTKFGAKVEEATQKLIDRGRALRAALKQKRYEHVDMPEQVIIFFLSNEGYLQLLPLTDVETFIAAFISQIRKRVPDILDTVEVTREINEAVIERLRAAADEFSKAWHR